MQPSLEKLRKFFGLERERHYDNSAIIGGLAKMLDYWEAEARAEGVSEEVIQAVGQRLRSYEGLSPVSRADALKGLWKRIGETYPEAGQRPRGVPNAKSVQNPQSPESATDTTSTSAAVEEPQPTTVKGMAPNRPASAPANRQGGGSRPRQAQPSRAESAPGGKHSQTPAALSAPLTVLQGVGPRHAATLESLGLRTLGDMLYYFPRRYEDYSQLKPIKSLWYGEQLTVIGTIQSVHTRPIRGGASTIVEAIISDGTGALRLSWFNQPWLANRLKEGQQISVSGKVDQYLGRLVMNSPDWEPVEIEHLHTNRIVPIYPLTARITQKWLRGLMNQVVTYWAPAVVDSLPESVRSSAGVMPVGQALLEAHFPDNQETLKLARERLAFDEIFYLQMGVLRQKRDWKEAEGAAVRSNGRMAKCTDSQPALYPDGRAATRPERHPRRPGLRQADEPPAARRRGLGQDGGRGDSGRDDHQQRLTGRDHGANRHPGGAALSQLHQFAGGREWNPAAGRDPLISGKHARDGERGDPQRTGGRQHQNRHRDPRRH